MGNWADAPEAVCISCGVGEGWKMEGLEPIGRNAARFGKNSCVEEKKRIFSVGNRWKRLWITIYHFIFVGTNKINLNP